MENEPSDLAKRIWREAVNARFYHSPPSGDTAAARVIDSYLPGPDDVEKVARAIDPRAWAMRDEDTHRRDEWESGLSRAWSGVSFEEWCGRFTHASLAQATAAIAALRGEA